MVAFYSTTGRPFEREIQKVVPPRSLPILVTQHLEKWSRYCLLGRKFATAPCELFLVVAMGNCLEELCMIRNRNPHAVFASEASVRRPPVGRTALLPSGTSIC